MKRAILLTLMLPALIASSASAAGEWGYFAVATQNGQAGIVLAGPGQRPGQVAGSAVASWVYLGPTSTSTPTMVRYLQQFATTKAAGFFEYPGGLKGMIGDAKSRANGGSMGALVWMKSTPGNAQWDSAPTAIAVSAVAWTAAPAALGVIEAAGGGAGITGAAGALGSKAKGVVGTLTGSGGSSNAPEDGTPASYLSVPKMAALAVTALVFDHAELNGATRADLTGGAFPQLYATVSGYAWDFGALMVVLLAVSVMVVPWAGGTLGALGAGLGRVAQAALLIAGVPLVTMLTLGLVDALCGALWAAVPHVKLMLDGLIATIAALAAASTAAGLTHHATIAHITGTGAAFVSGVGLLGAGLIALEMLAREVGVYLTVLFVPWMLVAAIFPAFASGGWKALKMLYAIVFSKAILMLALAAGATFLASLSALTMIVGLVILVLGAAAPFLLYSAFGHAQHMWHGRAISTVPIAPVSMLRSRFAS